MYPALLGRISLNCHRLYCLLVNVRYICKPWRIYFPKRGLLEYKLEFYTAVEWVQPTLAASAWVPKINVRYSIVHLVWALCGDRGRGPLGPECCVSAASHHPYSCAECILSKYRLFVKVYPLLMLQKLGWSVFCSGTINGSPRMRKVFTVLLNVISFTLASVVGTREVRGGIQLVAIYNITPRCH